MKDPRSHLPLRYQAINALGELLVAAKLPVTRLDEDSLCEAAMKYTGLEDFGDPTYRHGLQRLLESAVNEAKLHPLGRFMTNNIVSSYLVQRLRMQEARRLEPEPFEQPVIPPLIICGPARSGTTFLHNLLALDPAHRALPQWLLQRPFPDPAWDGQGTDPRYLKAEQGINFRTPLMHGMDAIHYTRADSYEECILALGLTFNSLIFFTLLPVYSYQEWYLQGEDAAQKYREYRGLLGIFQSQEPEKRLALKAPAHTGNLEALREVLPQALLVQTQRNLAACISSSCSLLYTNHLAAAYEIDVPRMARLILEIFETFGKRNLDFRQAHPDQVYDVFYDSLVADPLSTVRGIYAHFDLPWSEAYESLLVDYIQANKKDKHGKHRYSAADFGLEEGEIAERAKFYTDYFDL